MLQTGSLSHARRFERSILTGMFTNIVFSHQNQTVFQNTEQNEHDLKEGDRNMNNTQARSSADAPKSKPLDRSKKLNSARCAERKEVEHAIFSADPVIEGFETREDWISHREIVVQGLNPVGALESIHAERAALYLWRLKRVTRYETTATQFDHAEVMAEFIVSLDHPEFPRDRSEAVTIEKIRKPLRDYLNDFQSMGAQAAKLPEHQEGLERVRKEAKRVRQRRLLPDQPTIQTIIKYEAHLERCLSKTMAELRRLQKERRQGLRPIIEESAVRHPVNTPEAPATHDLRNETRETIEKANREVDLEESPDRIPDRTTPRPSEQEIPTAEPPNAKANLQASRLKDVDPTLDARRFTSTFINTNNHTNMKQARREIFTHDDPPNTDDSALSLGVTQACPIALEPPLHRME